MRRCGKLGTVASRCALRETLWHRHTLRALRGYWSVILYQDEQNFSGAFVVLMPPIPVAFVVFIRFVNVGVLNDGRAELPPEEHRKNKKNRVDREERYEIDIQKIGNGAAADSKNLSEINAYRCDNKNA